MNSYFDYLQERFFGVNCGNSIHHYGAGIYFMGCTCDGYDYSGTPNLAFNYKNKTEIDERLEASK
jgi:hypothetical protein